MEPKRTTSKSSDNVKPIALTVAQAAKAVNASQATIRRAIKSGDLIACKLGRSVRILIDDLRSWVQSHRLGSAHE